MLQDSDSAASQHSLSIPLVWCTDTQAESAWEAFTTDCIEETY